MSWRVVVFRFQVQADLFCRPQDSPGPVSQTRNWLRAPARRGLSAYSPTMTSTPTCEAMLYISSSMARKSSSPRQKGKAPSCLGSEAEVVGTLAAKWLVSPAFAGRQNSSRSKGSGSSGDSWSGDRSCKYPGETSSPSVSSPAV